MNAVRCFTVAVAAIVLSGCSRKVSGPVFTPEPGPDLRAEEGFLYWADIPIGGMVAGEDRAPLRSRALISTRAPDAAPPWFVPGPLSDVRNVVVVATGCLPAVRQSCVGSFPDYRIHYDVDGALWWDRQTSVASAEGRRLWLSFFGYGWTPADTGTHTIRVVLDATNRYPELDETNNEVSYQVRVIPGDLVAGMIEFIDWSAGFPRRVDTARVGAPLDVVTWSHAWGNFENHRSVFEMDGTPLFDRRMSLRGGTIFSEIRRDTVHLTPLTPGAHTFQRRADPDREFMDGDRSNNVSTATLTVTGAK